MLDKPLYYGFIIHHVHSCLSHILTQQTNEWTQVYFSWSQPIPTSPPDKQKSLVINKHIDKIRRMWMQSLTINVL